MADTIKSAVINFGCAVIFGWMTGATFTGYILFIVSLALHVWWREPKNWKKRKIEPWVVGVFLLTAWVVHFLLFFKVGWFTSLRESIEPALFSHTFKLPR